MRTPGQGSAPRPGSRRFPPFAPFHPPAHCVPGLPGSAAPVLLWREQNPRPLRDCGGAPRPLPTAGGGEVGTGRHGDGAAAGGACPCEGRGCGGANFPRPTVAGCAECPLCWVREPGSRPGTRERRPPILPRCGPSDQGQPIASLAVTVRISVLFRRLLPYLP